MANEELWHVGEHMDDEGVIYKNALGQWMIAVSDCGCSGVELTPEVIASLRQALDEVEKRGSAPRD